MSSPYVAEIRIFGFNFPPRGWAYCDGQILPLSQNIALFSLLGTTYGGDGKSNFALPNFQGLVPIHPGQGPGLSLHDLGETGGSETVTLLQSEMPSHQHTMRVHNLDQADTQVAASDTSIAQSANGSAFQTGTSGLVAMNANTIGLAGSSFPHNNMQPYLTLNFCIAMSGIFPPRG
jgi:microcystin-dependent protein